MSTQLAVVVGDVINDLIVRPTTPISTGTDTPAVIEPALGGSGANLAAWMGASGAAVRFVGRAGAGDAAEHRAALEALGVDARISSDEHHPTGSIVVLVDPRTGERTMMTDRGASAWLGTADLPGSLLEGAALLHVSGYAFFSAITRPAIIALWELAGATGLERSVDPSSVAGLREMGVDAFLEWTAGADLCFPNLDEARLLTGRSDPAEALDRLAERYRTVVLSLGKQGAVAQSGGEVIRRTPAAADEEALTDSTGAGDALCAGVLSARLAGQPLDQQLDAGMAAAALAIGRPGGRPLR